MVGFFLLLDVKKHRPANSDTAHTPKGRKNLLRATVSEMKKTFAS